MPFHTPTTWPWVACAIILSLVIAIYGRRKNARLPPGPTPFPILGNVLDFPRKHLGREFAAMSKTFGDVVHLDMLGQNVIVLGSLKAARDLLDKRSANYSDRPSSVMVELVEYDWLTALAPYGPRWRQHRRALHSVMAPDALSQYEAVQVDVARNFLRMVFTDPQGLASHIEFASASAILKVIYGIEIREANDRHYEMVDRMRAVAETISIPGNFPVEAFPVLRYLPSWFPGGGFKTWAADAKRDVSHISESLFKRAMDEGIKNPSRPSAIKRIFQLEGPRTQAEQSSELYRICKDVAATCFLGGADTGNATVGAFFFAMAAHPEAQKKAQRELDAVVGTARLPDFSDRHSLPYFNALVKELLRWHPSIPMGLPHAAVADDEHNGYLIPGGATVLVNIWAILRDPEVYPQPEEFMPERFLDSSGNLDVHGRDPADVMFGFGRRICPGQTFAESMLFILLASFLSAFEIGPPVGEDGLPMELKWEASDNWIVSHPKIHEYSIKPRSAHVERLTEMADTQ